MNSAKNFACILIISKKKLFVPFVQSNTYFHLTDRCVYGVCPSQSAVIYINALLLVLCSIQSARKYFWTSLHWASLVLALETESDHAKKLEFISTIIHIYICTPKQKNAWDVWSYAYLHSFTNLTTYTYLFV